MKIANIAGAMGGSSRTYLTHLFGRGLDDEKYRVERFRSMAEGMIRPRARRPRSRQGEPQRHPNPSMPPQSSPQGHAATVKRRRNRRLRRYFVECIAVVTRVS